MDTPLAAASTLSTMQTFDQETISSGQQLRLRQRGAHDARSTSTQLSSSKNMPMAKASSAIVVSTPTYKTQRQVRETNESFLLLSFVQRVIFTVLLFAFEWSKYLFSLIFRRRQAKISTTPTRLDLRQPEQVVRRMEIQERSMDNLIHRTNTQTMQRQPYLSHNPDQHREHLTTTMSITPPPFNNPVVDDDDFTCSESVIPETHLNAFEGQPSPWKVVTVNPNSSSNSTTSSWSKWMRTRQEEPMNWME